jgi:hypothetical protein
MKVVWKRKDVTLTVVISGAFVLAAVALLVRLL